MIAVKKEKGKLKFKIMIEEKTNKIDLGGPLRGSMGAKGRGSASHLTGG